MRLSWKIYNGNIIRNNNIIIIFCFNYIIIARKTIYYTININYNYNLKIIMLNHIKK